MAPKDKSKTPEGVPTPARSKAYKAPGRLGDPSMQLYQDPRANAKLVDILSKYGIDRNRAPPSLGTLRPDSTMEDLWKSMAEPETGFEKLYETLPNELPSDAIELEVVCEMQKIPGPSGRSMKLHIFRPELRGGPLPGLIYLHGGAMTILRAMSKVHQRWCCSLAAQGMVVMMLDFRNAWSREEYNPFPAGLDDCCTAVHYIHLHKDQFNIRNLVLQGDDGGATLALATALRANREGWHCMLDGVYASSPMLSAAYAWPEERKLSELPSLVECHGYYLNVDYLGFMAQVYTPKSGDKTNPLAWPFHATTEDLEGLPPHVIAVDELSPLRDEGIAYCRKLSAAGVRVCGHVNIGHTHAAGLIFRQALAEANRTAVKNIAAFTKSA
ncbi:uncharacterized protein MYCFIDRAFT_195458 [Pseudocercospora fijiensis CIRAD86]|uniref:Alpha/beta hydrolase fold-3 domain-containing protein n=1 Tax=Pseudocercospora fijiensis (strain CIRAD86) TaxID=383855 RepID=M3B4X7_PSEFD|nr:uncharacterized protein MYCFIDRAFT_195458 [Pseudocercospora fijiensis CIRAD86]EME84397.1 hypothetical protein MYCFIDRAFT_195458 [Pseudocercospora fijiensis CIRAD86]